MTTLAGKGSLPHQESNITKTEIVSTKDGSPKHTTTTRNLNPTGIDITRQIDIIRVVTHQETGHMNRSFLSDSTDAFMLTTIGRTILKNHHQERGHISIRVTSNNRVKARDIITGTTDSTAISNTVDRLKTSIDPHKTSITRTTKTLATRTGDREAIHDRGKYR